MALTKSQKLHLNYLQSEKKRQSGSYLEYTSYPEFHLNCHGCFMEYATDDPEHAIQFINDHAGHKAFSMEINQRPDAVVYDREEVLEQIIQLGLYVAEISIWVDNLALEQTRVTYKFIKNGGDIGGVLERLMSVYEGDNGPPNHRRWVDTKARLWLEAIQNQDQKFLQSEIVANN